MSLTGDTFDFQQGNVVTSSAQLVDNAATVGDVLTVQTDKSIAAAPGSGSLPANPLTTNFELVAPQTLTSGVYTTLLLTVQGVDGIGVSVAAGQITVPAGWYLASVTTYWEADNTGSRYLAAALGDATWPDVLVSGAAYAVLDFGNGLTLGPSPFHALAPSDVVYLQAFQNSGGDLDVSSGGILKLQKLA